jgi:2-polyprenyl-6-hydroxyphenyl methylase/3-demethylubiquinone-9 3-methyltransferase
MTQNIDELKKDKSLHVRLYNLREATVYTTKYGYHFTNYFDDPYNSMLSPGYTDSENPNPEIDEGSVEMIDKVLESNPERYERQLSYVKKYITISSDTKILDIGSGGGRFLSMLQPTGADMVGIELYRVWAEHARKKYKLNIVSEPLESQYWNSYKNHFDLITLWDVIEHVNYPSETLQIISSLLKPGGYLMLDTPCRDSLFYLIGRLSYTISFGKYPTFLNIMYSDRAYSHKQIFSSKEILNEINYVGLQTKEFKRLFELSLPTHFYIKKLIRNRTLAKPVSSLVNLLIKLCYIRNKMILIAQKPQIS